MLETRNQCRVHHRTADDRRTNRKNPAASPDTQATRLIHPEYLTDKYVYSKKQKAKQLELRLRLILKQEPTPANASMNLNISHLRIGQRANIELIRSDAPSTNLLSAMGLLPGKCVEVTRFAPLGDPIAVLVEGQHISLRRADAADVSVILLNEEGGAK